MSNNHYSLYEIIEKIISETGLSKDKIQDLIKAKLDQFGNYFTEIGAARIVAEELGVELTSNTSNYSTPLNIKIKDITTGLKNITLTARVIRVYDLITFERSDKTEGLMQSLILCDDTGEIKAILWNQAALSFSEKNCNVGDIVRFIGAYTKLGNSGNVEVHASSRTIIQIRPSDLSTNELPYYIPRTKIVDLKPMSQDIAIIGQITQKEEPSFFLRSDGTKGQRQRIAVADETGEVFVNFWNEKVTKLEKLEVGDYIEVVGLNTKPSTIGTVELHSTRLTRIRKISHTLLDTIKRGFVSQKQVLSPMPQEIKDITESNAIVSINALIVDVKPIYMFNKKDGSKGYVRNILVSDNTGIIRVALWGKHAESIKEIDAFRLIKIRNAYVKRGKFENIEINCFSNTELHLEDIDEKEIRRFIPPFINISDVRGQKRVNIQGTIVKISEKRVVKSKDDNDIELQSFTISDHTAMIKVICWGSNIKKLTPFKEGDVIELINATVKHNDKYETELIVYSDTVIRRKSGLISRYSEFIPGTLANIANKTDVVQNIESIKEGITATINGTIIDINYNTLKLLPYCPYCNTKVQRKNQNYLCTMHGVIKQPTYLFEIEFTINDGTGSLIVTADKQSLSDLISLTTSYGNDEIGIKSNVSDALTTLIHSEVKVRGVIAAHDYLDHLKVIAKTITSIKYKLEIRRVLQNSFI